MGAAAGLAISYGVGSFVMLAVEPGMGFRSVADYFDPLLLVPALDSVAWLVSDVCHLVNGCLIAVLGVTLAGTASAAHRLTRITAAGAAILFILLAMLDRAAAGLPALVADNELRSTIALAFVSARMGVLFAAVCIAGAFTISVTAILRDAPVAHRVTGYAVGAAAFGFWLVPTPIPVLLAVWSASVAWYCRASRVVA